MRGAVIRHILVVILAPFVAFVLPPWQQTVPDIAPDFSLPSIPETSGITEEIAEPIGVPLRIIIPSIGVDAAIRDVGLTKELAMDLTKNPLDTSWYRFGARPGAIGSAVIAGHVSWYNHETAVFENLHTINIGDTITILDDKNNTMTFVVRGFQSFSATDSAESVFTSNDGKSHVNLVTCEGAWNEKLEQFTNRFVVFAERTRIELSQ